MQKKVIIDSILRITPFSKPIPQSSCVAVKKNVGWTLRVWRTTPSNMRTKLTAKLKSLTAFSLITAYPAPVMPMLTLEKNKNYEAS